MTIWLCKVSLIKYHYERIVDIANKVALLLYMRMVTVLKLRPLLQIYIYR